MTDIVIEYIGCDLIFPECDPAAAYCASPRFTDKKNPVPFFLDFLNILLLTVTFKLIQYFQQLTPLSLGNNRVTLGSHYGNKRVIALLNSRVLDFSAKNTYFQPTTRKSEI